MSKENYLHKTVFELQQLVVTNSSTAAFEQLYLHFYKGLHNFAYRIIKSNHIAEEIVSDVFVQVWKKRAELGNILNLRVFLYVSVKNQSLTYLYKANKQRVCWIEEFATDTKQLSINNNSEELLNAKELSTHIRKAIDHLPVKCRAIFKLVKEDGLKYNEAARILNLSIKTIENQMGIALKKIALALKIAEYTL